MVKVTLISALVPIDRTQQGNGSIALSLTYPILYDCSITVEHVLFHLIITDIFGA